MGIWQLCIYCGIIIFNFAASRWHLDGVNRVGLYALDTILFRKWMIFIINSRPLLLRCVGAHGFGNMGFPLVIQFNTVMRFGNYWCNWQMNLILLLFICKLVVSIEATNNLTVSVDNIKGLVNVLDASLDFVHCSYK